jgi:hypothetical protein
MLEKTNLAEQEFDSAVNAIINHLRSEVENLKKQIENLKSDLRYYESQSTKNL